MTNVYPDYCMWVFRRVRSSALRTYRVYICELLMDSEKYIHEYGANPIQYYLYILIIHV